MQFLKALMVVLCCALLGAAVFGGSVLARNGSNWANNSNTASNTNSTRSNSSPASNRSNSNAPAGGNQPANPDDSPGPEQNPAETLKVEMSNPDFVQPKTDKLPENKKEAQEELRKAWDAIYSARRSGLKKVAGEVTYEISVPNLAQKMRSKARYALDGTTAYFRITEGQKFEIPGLMDSSGQFPAIYNVDPSTFGFMAFDEHFKNVVFTFDDGKDAKVKIVRCWYKGADAGVTSLYFTLSEGLIQRADFKEFNYFNISYSKIGSETFCNAMSMRVDSKAGGQSMSVVGTIKVTERKTIDGFKIGTKMTMTMVTSGVSVNGAIEFKDIVTNDNVTDKMIKDAQPAASDTPKESGDKPEPPAQPKEGTPSEEPGAEPRDDKTRK